MVLAQTMEGAWFGAFNPDGWRGDDDYRAGANAFLFAFPAAMGGEAWVKSEKVASYPIGFLGMNSGCWK